jgi:DNA-binding MarR family transcriptional regulator
MDVFHHKKLHFCDCQISIAIFPQKCDRMMSRHTLNCKYFQHVIAQNSNDYAYNSYMDNNKSRPADLYLRFLQLANAVRGLPSLDSLDPLEDRILTFVAHLEKDRQRLSVRDLMERREFGSPATLHTKLKSMRSKGWITLEETEDTRRKQVVLSAAAWQHLDTLSSCLLQATQAQAQSGDHL